MNIAQPASEISLRRILRGRLFFEAAAAVALTSIVAFVALPAYRESGLRRAGEAVVGAADSAKATVEDFARFHARLPLTEEVSLPFVTARHVASTSWSAAPATPGSITVWLRAESGAEREAFEGKALVLTARFDAATRRVDWQCGDTHATTLATRYLPTGCGPRAAAP